MVLRAAHATAHTTAHATTHATTHAAAHATTAAATTHAVATHGAGYGGGSVDRAHRSHEEGTTGVRQGGVGAPCGEALSLSEKLHGDPVTDF